MCQIKTKSNLEAKVGPQQGSKYGLYQSYHHGTSRQLICDLNKYWRSLLLASLHFYKLHWSMFHNRNREPGGTESVYTGKWSKHRIDMR